MTKQAENIFLYQEKKFENNELIDVQEFDKRGNLIRHQDRIALENEKEEKRNNETYDNSGKLIRESIYFSEGVSEIHHEYDDNGFIERVISLK